MFLAPLGVVKLLHIPSTRVAFPNLYFPDCPFAECVLLMTQDYTTYARKSVAG